MVISEFAWIWGRLLVQSWKKKHPVSTVEETLQEVSEANVFSKLAPNTAFHQIELHPDSRDNFCSPRQPLEVQVLVFWSQYDNWEISAADMAKSEGLFPRGKVSLNFKWSLVVFLKAQFLVHYYFLYNFISMLWNSRFPFICRWCQSALWTKESLNAKWTMNY